MRLLYATTLAIVAMTATVVAGVQLRGVVNHDQVQDLALLQTQVYEHIAAGTPVEKVHGLLDKMEPLLEKSLNNAVTQKKAHEERCKTRLSALHASIAQKEEEHENARTELIKLEARIAPKADDSASTLQSIKQLEDQVAAKQAAINKGEIDRNRKHETFVSVKKEYDGLVDNASRLLAALKTTIVAGTVLSGDQINTLSFVEMEASRRVSAHMQRLQALEALSNKALQSGNTETVSRMVDLLTQLTDSLRASLQAKQADEDRHAAYWSSVKDDLAKEIGALQTRRAALIHERDVLEQDLKELRAARERSQSVRDATEAQVKAQAHMLEEEKEMCDATAESDKRALQRHQDEMETIAELRHMLNKRSEELAAYIRSRVATSTGTTGSTGATGSESATGSTDGDDTGASSTGVTGPAGDEQAATGGSA